MSNYRGHVFGALAFSLIYLSVLALGFAVDLIPDDREIFSGFMFPISLVGLAVLFGLWPDVDTNSKGQNIFYSIFFVADIILISQEQFEQAAYLGLLAMLPVLSKHRGWTHARISAFIIPLPFLVLPYIYNSTDPWNGLPYYGAAVIGYISHLWFDGILFKRKKKR